MGLNQDIATLALSSLVRDTARGDARFVAGLMSRLADPERKLIQAIQDVIVRAWRAWEIIVLGPYLVKYAQEFTPDRSSEIAAALQALSQIVEEPSGETLLAPTDRSECVLELRRAFDAGLLRQVLDPAMLSQQVAAMASLDIAVFRREEERLSGSLMRQMFTLGWRVLSPRRWGSARRNRLSLSSPRESFCD